VIDEMEAVDRAEANQAVREAIDKHASMAAPDPAKYWGGLGFAGSVGMILADSLDRIGSSMKGEKPSNLIERGIERSLQQQQAALDKSRADITQAQGLYAQMRQSGMDKEHAFQAAKARRMEDAAGIIDSYQRQARLPQVKQQLAMQAADLRERAGASFLQLSESIAGQGKGRQVAASGGGLDYSAAERMLKMRKLQAEVQQEENKAAGNEDRPLSDTEIKVKEKLANIRNTRAQMKKAIGLIPSQSQHRLANASGGWLVGEDGQRFLNKAKPIVAAGVNELSGASYGKDEWGNVWNDHIGNTTDPVKIRAAMEEKDAELAAKEANYAGMLPGKRVVEYNSRVGQENTRNTLRGR
jgi:hypothetical protein